MPCVVGTIAVDGQVGDRHIVDLAKSCSNNAIDTLIEAIGEPDRRLPHALSDKRDATKQFDRTLRRVGRVAGDCICAGGKLNSDLPGAWVEEIGLVRIRDGCLDSSHILFGVSCRRLDMNDRGHRRRPLFGFLI